MPKGNMSGYMKYASVDTSGRSPGRGSNPTGREMKRDLMQPPGQKSSRCRAPAPLGGAGRAKAPHY